MQTLGEISWRSELGSPVFNLGTHLLIFSIAVEPQPRAMTLIGFQTVLQTKH